jgi:hypothetical protein
VLSPSQCFRADERVAKGIVMARDGADEGTALATQAARHKATVHDSAAGDSAVGGAQIPAVTLHPTDESQRGILQAALERADLTVDQPWPATLPSAGPPACWDIAGYLQRLMPLPATERDLLATAVNERLREQAWRHRVPYANAVREPLPNAGPLPALSTCCCPPAPHQRSSCLQPPTPQRARGVTVAIFVIDNYECEPRPVRAFVEPPREAASPPLAVDTTLAGRASREVATVSSDVDGTNLLWVPLLDDAERVGVLRVTFNTPHRTDPSPPFSTRASTHRRRPRIRHPARAHRRGSGLAPR